MEIKEIRELNEKDLRERIESTRRTLQQLHLNHTVSPLENTSQIKKTKKDITKMLTVLSEIEHKKQAK